MSLQTARVAPGRELDALVVCSLTSVGCVEDAEHLWDLECSTDQDGGRALLEVMMRLMSEAHLYRGFSLMTRGPDVLVHLQLCSHDPGPVSGVDVPHAFSLMALKTLSEPFVNSAVLLTRNTAGV